MPVASSSINLTCTTEGCNTLVSAIAQSSQVAFTQLWFLTEYSIDPLSTTYSAISSYTPVAVMTPLQVLTDTTTSPNIVKISGFYSSSADLTGDIHTVALIGTLNNTNVLIALDSRSSSETIYTLQGNDNIAIDLTLAIDNADATAAIQVNNLNIMSVPATNATIGSVVLSTATDIITEDDGTALQPKTPTPSAVKQAMATACGNLAITIGSGSVDYSYELKASSTTNWTYDSGLALNVYTINSQSWYALPGIEYGAPTSVFWNNDGEIVALGELEWNTSLGDDEDPIGIVRKQINGNTYEFNITFAAPNQQFRTSFPSNLDFIVLVGEANVGLLKSSHGYFSSINSTNIDCATINASAISATTASAILPAVLGTLKDSSYDSGSLILGAYSFPSGSTTDIVRGTTLSEGTIYTSATNASGGVTFNTSASDYQITLSSSEQWINLNPLKYVSNREAVGLFMKA